MQLTINSKNHGTVTFHTQGTYIYVSLDTYDFAYRQICVGGHFLGKALQANPVISFERRCRLWWRAFLKNQR